MSLFDRSISLLFWISLALPLYSYAVFPLLILGLGSAAARRTSSRRTAHTDALRSSPPPAAIVVSAFNEEQHLTGLVSNLLSLQYPARVTLYIGSDGSTDRTAQILEACADARVRVFTYAQNRGKASVINDLLAQTSEPIVMFTDANTRLEPDALMRLAARFEDPRVGCVVGELTLRANGGDNVDGVYWRIERLLKTQESALGALLGANGGIYAIRRECFVPIRADTIIDDFCIAMTISAAGRSVIYEPAARAVEDVPQRITDEFKRRVRIGIGNYQAFFRHPEYLFRTSRMTRFAYVSHKVLRWFTPHLLILALLLNALLLDRLFFRALWLIQGVLYASCFLLYLLAKQVVVPRLLRWPAFLVAMNVAFAVGFLSYVSGNYTASWKRTARV